MPVDIGLDDPFLLNEWLAVAWLSSLPASKLQGVVAALSYFGVIHAFMLTPQGVGNRLGWWVAPGFTLSYLAAALFLLALPLVCAK
jgi:phosphate/sulfate permease